MAAIEMPSLVDIMKPTTLGLAMLCRIQYAMLDYAGGADVHYGLAAADDDVWLWLHQLY